jgi:hypothetical protein
VTEWGKPKRCNNRSAVFQHRYVSPVGQHMSLCVRCSQVKALSRLFYFILRDVPRNAPYSVVHCLILEKNDSIRALYQTLRNDVSCDIHGTCMASCLK